MKLNVKKFAKDKVGTYIVSTVCKDGVYETAIKQNDGNYIVVGRYPDSERATIGHKYWRDFCKTEPMYVRDIDTNQQTLF